MQLFYFTQAIKSGDKIMKKPFSFFLEERLREAAKKQSKRQRSPSFSEFSAEAYCAGVRLNKVAFEKNINPDDLIFYLENCINATDVDKAISLLQF